LRHEIGFGRSQAFQAFESSQAYRGLGVLQHSGTAQTSLN